MYLLCHLHNLLSGACSHLCTEVCTHYIEEISLCIELALCHKFSITHVNSLSGWMKLDPTEGTRFGNSVNMHIRGETPVYYRFVVKGVRVSAITAMYNEGVVAIELTTGTDDTEKFFDFVMGELLPNMQPFEVSRQ